MGLHLLGRAPQNGMAPAVVFWLTFKSQQHNGTDSRKKSHTQERKLADWPTLNLKAGEREKQPETLSAGHSETLRMRQRLQR